MNEWNSKQIFVRGILAPPNIFAVENLTTHGGVTPANVQHQFITYGSLIETYLKFFASK